MARGAPPVASAREKAFQHQPLEASRASRMSLDSQRKRGDLMGAVLGTLSGNSTLGPLENVRELIRWGCLLPLRVCLV